MARSEYSTFLCLKTNPTSSNKRVSYNPFNLDLKYNYYIEKSSDNNGYLYCYEKNENEEYLFKIYFEEHVPSGALLLLEKITGLSGQTVLDLGAGTGIISVFAGMRHIRKAIAVDIEPKRVEIAKYNAKLNNLDKRIGVSKGDLFNSVQDYKFDKIIVNPPQMPTPRNNYDVQDYGGVLGWDFLDRMINTASSYLTSHGEIWIFLTDFIGISMRYGDYPTLFERLENNDFRPNIAVSANRAVRKEGATEKMIPYVLSIYPKYKFFDDFGNYYDDPDSIRNKLRKGTKIYYGVKVVKCVLK